VSYPRSRGEAATCTHTSIRWPRIQGVVRLAFALVPGVKRVAEVPRPRSEHGPISRPQGLTRTKGTGTGTGTIANVGNANASTLVFPTTERQTNRHAAAFRSRQARSRPSRRWRASRGPGPYCGPADANAPHCRGGFSSLRGALSAVVSWSNA